MAWRWGRGRLWRGFFGGDLDKRNGVLGGGEAPSSIDRVELQGFRMRNMHHFSSDLRKIGSSSLIPRSSPPYTDLLTAKYSANLSAPLRT